MAVTPLSIESLGISCLHSIGPLACASYALTWKLIINHNSNKNSNVYTDNSANNHEYWQMLLKSVKSFEIS